MADPHGHPGQGVGGMSEEEALALALANSMESSPPPPPTASPEAMSEEEQLAYALSLSAAADVGPPAAAANGASEDEALAWALQESLNAEAAAQPGGGGAPPAAPPAGLRVVVTGAAEVSAGGRGDTHMVYSLEVEGQRRPARTCTRRFSAFVELLNRLGREAPGERVSREARGCVDGWKTRLLVEKRHAGRGAKAPAIVSARVALLQRMLDELLAFPEICSSAPLAAFLA